MTGDYSARCTLSIVIGNFYGRLFNFLGSYERVATTLLEFDTQDGMDIYLQMLLVGREGGKSIRNLFGLQIRN